MIKLDYQLLDSGNGHTLERFGKNIISRPDSTIIWKPQNYNWKPDAIYTNEGWQIKGSFKQPWVVSCGTFSLELKLSKTKNIGIFPEQVENWKWLTEVVRSYKNQAEVLNLFGYTGGSTLAVAMAGGKVVHVDSSQAVITWFLKNKNLNSLDVAPIRHIVDDCIKFVAREVKRGARYDGIILDPPAFGKGKDGQFFKFEKDISKLLELCKRLSPSFVLLNSYSMGYSPYVIGNALEDAFPNSEIECGDLFLEEVSRKRLLQCGIYARFKK